MTLIGLGVLSGLAARRRAKSTKSYRRAIALKPDFAHAHCNLASALNQQGLHEEAAESAARAVELMPGLAEAHFNHAAALAGRRRLVDAEAAFRRVLALQPDNARTLTDPDRS